MENMPRRILPLVSDQYYHLYNRGVARHPIFQDKRDYNRFLLALRYYRFFELPFKLSRLLQLPLKDQDYLWKENNKGKSQVEILSWVLMPNHFHFLVKQVAENGISHFVSKMTNSYTKYFNTKHKRVGPLFQGPFKAVRIESEEQLLHVSRYIHLNPLVSYIVKEKDFLTYPWSSLKDYRERRESFIRKEMILGCFPTIKAYEEFILNHADYAKELEKIKHLLIESNGW